MVKPLNVDPKIVNNGLSLERIGLLHDDNSIRLLALNGKVIPGQIAIEYGKPDFWGVRHIKVMFEVYTADGESQMVQKELEKEV